MKTKILIMLCIVVFVACKKDRNPEPTPEPKTYLTKMTQAIGVSTFNYDEQNRLKNRVFVSSNESASVSYTNHLIYDANNRVIEQTFDVTNPTADDYSYKNTYDANGKVVLETYTNLRTGALISSNSYTYTANKTTTTKKNAAGAVQSSEVATYSADGKNTIETAYLTSSGILSGTRTYEGYDDKKSFMQLYPVGYTTPVFQQNNHKTQIYTNSSNGAITTLTITYEYNTDGYITKRTTSAGSVDTFEYIKK